jgi:hypothetical protein
MHGLQTGLPETRLAFDNRMFGISSNISQEKRQSYMASFDLDSMDETIYHQAVIEDGLRIFEQVFEIKPHSFIAPNYVWHRAVEAILARNGIRYLQGINKQFQPTGHGRNVVRHTLGQKNSCGQIHLLRNCAFEPSSMPTKNHAASALNDISLAFKWHKPAIISSHRVNFMGSLREENRSKNLVQFKTLLSDIVKLWPDAEFMDTVELGVLIGGK